MQIDPDLDARHSPDVVADGELDEGSDSDLDPLPPAPHIATPGASASSYHTKRALSAPHTVAATHPLIVFGL